MYIDDKHISILGGEEDEDFRVDIKYKHRNFIIFTYFCTTKQEVNKFINEISLIEKKADLMKMPSESISYKKKWFKEK